MELDRIRAGDEEALALLLEECWGPLVRYLWGITASSAEAEDAAQEAFVRLWERREEWTAGSPRGLVFRIARNVALDAERRRRTRSRLQPEAAGATSAGPPTPEQELRDARVSARVQAAVAALPSRRRETFELVRFHGLSYRQAAEALEVSEQTVANQMSRAMLELRASLQDLLAGERGAAPDASTSASTHEEMEHG